MNKLYNLKKKYEVLNTKTKKKLPIWLIFFVLEHGLFKKKNSYLFTLIVWRFYYSIYHHSIIKYEYYIRSV